MIRSVKDKTLSRAIALAVNTKIRKFGTMLDFKLDSRTKTIELEIMLKGETEPLFVKVQRYEILEENGRYFLLAERIVTSREWINVVAESYLQGQRIEIAPRYARLLQLVV